MDAPSLLLPILDRIHVWFDRFNDAGTTEQGLMLGALAASAWAFGCAAAKICLYEAGVFSRWQERRRDRREQSEKTKLVLLARAVAEVLDRDARHDEMIDELALKAKHPIVTGSVSNGAWVVTSHGHEGDAGAYEKPAEPVPSAPPAHCSLSNDMDQRAARASLLAKINQCASEVREGNSSALLRKIG